MADQRELILARLVEIGAGIEGIKTAKRNELGQADTALPGFVVFDGDEAADDRDPVTRPPTAPRIMTMTPEIYVLLPEKTADVGTQLNLYRARLINAIANDSTLATLTKDSEGGRYEGAATGLSRGRQMVGDVGLSFSFRYVLRPGSI